MTDPRRQNFLKYVRLIADLYGLKDWSFEIADYEPDDKDAIAAISNPEGRKIGIIYLGSYFLDASKEEQRCTILHELTHCHTNMLVKFAQRKLQNTEDFNPLMEYAVDGIAIAIAHYFPLPE